MAEENMEEETSKQDELNFNPSFDQDHIPLCLSWSITDVAKWIEHLGFPQYRDCFVTNYINGRRLINIDGSSLPKIGITDYEHIKFISMKIREILGIEEPYWNRSISLTPREPKTLFLERKSETGEESNARTYEEHLRELHTFSLHGVPEKHNFIR
eukprot:gene14286-15775_t